MMSPMSWLVPPPSILEMMKVEIAGTNTMVMPVLIPGKAQRNDHPCHHLEGVAAQVLCRLDDIVANLAHGGVQRRIINGM